MKRHRVLAAGVAAVALFGLVPSTASAKSGRTFLPSVHVNADETATFPLRHGVTTDGRDLWFVIIDASNSNAAAKYGVNVSNKLRNVVGTSAVMPVTEHNGTWCSPPPSISPRIVWSSAPRAPASHQLTSRPARRAKRATHR